MQSADINDVCCVGKCLVDLTVIPYAIKNCIAAHAIVQNGVILEGVLTLDNHRQGFVFYLH